MRLHLTIIVVSAMVLLAANGAMARENVYGFGTTTPNPGPNIQTNFHVCVRGDITGIINTYSGQFIAPDFQDHIEVTYDGGTNVTSIVWFGSWSVRTDGIVPNFGFDTGFIGGWSTVGSGWGLGSCASFGDACDLALELDTLFIGACGVVVTNCSPLDVRLNSVGILAAPAPFTGQDLNPTTLPLGAFATIGTNVFVPAGSSAEVDFAPASFWGVTSDTALVLNGTYSLFCGTYFAGNPGYGNNWNQTLTFSHTVTDPAVSSTIDWSFTLRQDTEAGYDHVYIEYNQGGSWQILQTQDGVGTEQINQNFTLLPTGYAGPGNDEIRLRVRFASDGAWSDEDGLLSTATGACQIDDVTVSVDGASVSVDGFESGQTGAWQPGIAVPPPTAIDYCTESANAIGALLDWWTPLGGYVGSNENIYAVADLSLSSVPTDALSTVRVEAYPNPFNPSTTISYTLPGARHVDLSIYDLGGRRVVRLVDSEQSAGSHNVAWSGLDEAGRSVPSGVYLVRLTAGATNETVNLILLK